MPNRIIKEGAFTSEKISDLTDFQFRLWVGLITQADDAGRGDARPAIIKGRVFALRERVTVKDVDAALCVLAAAGCVSLYKVGGKPYYAFPNLTEHQRIRNSIPKYPSPDEADAEDTTSPQLAATRGNSPQDAALIQSESNPNTNPNLNPKRDAPAPAKRSFGEFGNVLLTDEELQKLKAQFPDYAARIDRLSGYIASTGKSYKSHYATILNWARRDGEQTQKPVKPGDIHGCGALGDAELEAIRKTLEEPAFDIPTWEVDA